MNRERAAELLPIITAFANGEDVKQYNAFSGMSEEDQQWLTVNDMKCDIEGLKFRVDPTPREWYIYDGNDEPIVTADLGDVAEQYWHKWIKVREVLDET